MIKRALSRSHWKQITRAGKELNVCRCGAFTATALWSHSSWCLSRKRRTASRKEGTLRAGWNEYHFSGNYQAAYHISPNPNKLSRPLALRRSVCVCEKQMEDLSVLLRRKWRSWDASKEGRDTHRRRHTPFLKRDVPVIIIHVWMINRAYFYPFTVIFNAAER